MRDRAPGARYGQLVLVRPIGHRNWLCLCDCGRKHITSNLRPKGGTLSCGHVHRIRAQAYSKSHPVVKREKARAPGVD